MHEPYHIHDFMQAHWYVCVKQLFYQVNIKNRFLTHIMIYTLNMYNITQFLHHMKNLTKYREKRFIHAHFEQFSYFTQNLEILISDWKWF